MTDALMNDLIGTAGAAMNHSAAFDEYAERHGIAAAPFLTVIDDATAAAIVDLLAPRIEGKTVVEIGGGIGLLALHLGMVARRVYCFEANPMWSFSFTQVLLAQKPKNVSYIFGTADEMIGQIKGDVALFCSHSDISGMTLVASQFAPTVIDVYGEMIEANPDAFDPLAQELRKIA